MNKNIVPVLDILLVSNTLLSRAEIEDKMVHIKTAVKKAATSTSDTH